MADLNDYMVLVARPSGSVFVKELKFYKKQGGFVEPWGKNWVPIKAYSIEDAREKGCKLPHARAYSKQAKP